MSKSLSRGQFNVMAGTSFVAASLETMAFFAYLDPLMLGSKEMPQVWADNRIIAYAVAFCLSFGLTLAVSIVNARYFRAASTAR